MRLERVVSPEPLTEADDKLNEKPAEKPVASTNGSATVISFKDKRKL
jgi:hypothetical protein